MTRIRLAAIAAAAATLAALPAAGVAKNGADDAAPHVRHTGADDPATHLPHSGSDDSGNHTGTTPSGKKAAKKARVRVFGTCTAGAKTKITLKKRDGRIEAEFEVDENRAGVTWQVTLTANGVVVAQRAATTLAPSGSFEVKKKVADTSGADTVKGVATSPSGQTCTATATL